MAGPFARALDTVCAALAIQPETITGAAKGSGVIPRARALVGYLASTEGGMTDTDIAKALKRDRSSVHHMLSVVEAIREHPEIDEWLDRIARQAINPPAPCDQTRQLLITAHAERVIEPGTRKVAHDARPLPSSAEQALASLARQHDMTPRQTLSRGAPVAVRHAAWVALHATRTAHGGRYWTCERIAALSGVTRHAVSKAIRQSTARRAGA